MSLASVAHEDDPACSRGETGVPVDIGLVIKELVRLGAKPATERARRTPAVLRVLKKFHLDPANPPRDFEGVYCFAVVDAFWGAPEPVVRFFEHDNIKEAARASFEQGDYTKLKSAADDLFQWNDETRELGWIDYDPRRDIERFCLAIDEAVQRTRRPSEIRAENIQKNQHKKISTDLESILQAVGDERTDIEKLRGEIQDALDLKSSERLTLLEELREWFLAVGHGIEDFEEVSERATTWTIRIQVRYGRYERVVVRIVNGELRAGDVRAANEAISTHNAQEAWVVAERRVSNAAREAAHALNNVECFTLDELLDLDADFEPYLRWLDDQVEQKGLPQKYIDLACKKEEFDDQGAVVSENVYGAKSGWIDGYVDTWLDDSAKEHLSILGEFGTGKSWFCLHYAKRLGDQYRDAKERGVKRPRVPLVIPLRDYAKAVNIESLFSEFFFRKHELPLPGYSAFEQLNRMGRLLLIFDGFDEMAARVDRQSMINNFWELARTVVPNAKVILTCRTEHFPEAKEGRALLSAELRASTAALIPSAPQFEVLEMLPWDDQQVLTVLRKLTDEGTAQTILQDDELLSLMRRPVMSDLILDALPEISEGGSIDLTLVYLYAIRRKMARDIKDERTFTSIADKTFFLSEVSWQMYATDQMTLNYRDFPEALRACFGEAVQEARDLDHWHHDMASQTILIRNASGDYYPAHRSFIEFFVAFRLVAELGILSEPYLSLLNEGREHLPQVSCSWHEYFFKTSSARETHRIERFQRADTSRLADTFGSQAWSGPVAIMAAAMAETNSAEQLVELIQESRRDSKSKDWRKTVGNAAELAVHLDRTILRGADLSGVQIAGARFDLGWQSPDFSGVILDGADCSGVDFENVRLTGASLRGTDLTDVFFLGLHYGAPSVIQAAPSNSMAFVATDQGTLLRWEPYADSEPNCVWQGLGKRGGIREIEVSPDGAFLVIPTVDDGTLVINAEDGAIALHLPDSPGAVVLADESGATALEVLARVEGKEPVYRRYSLSSVAPHPDDFRLRLDASPNAEIAIYSPSLRRTVLMSFSGDVGRLESAYVRDGELVVEDLGTLNLPQARSQLRRDLTSEGGLAVRHFTGTGEVVHIFDPRGTLIFQNANPDEASITSGPGNFQPFDSRNFRVIPEGGVDCFAGRVALATGQDVSLWTVGDGSRRSPLWTTRVPGISDVKMTIEGDVMVVTRYHDLFLFEGLTGRVKKHQNHSSHMRGAVISGRHGLPPSMVAGLRNQGVIFEDAQDGS